MKINIKNLPVSNLPYKDISLCKDMIIKLFEKIPFYAELPNLDEKENVIFRTFENIPGIKFEKDKKIGKNKVLLIKSESAKFEEYSNKLDEVYNSNNKTKFENYSSESAFLQMYQNMLKRISPKYTIVKLIGPFSFAEQISNHETNFLISDKQYRKYIIQAIGIKALWYINKIKELSPKTTPIILFEENEFYKFGTIKRNNENINEDLIISLFKNLFKKIQENNAYVGVQCFNKCNWHIIIDANPDFISFGAYSNPNNLNVIPEKVHNFLTNGGYINWGIIPVTNENIIMSSNISSLEERFKKTVENLANEGVSLDLLYRHSMVSVQGDLADLPILYAEKALILANQLSQKIPISSRL